MLKPSPLRQLRLTNRHPIFSRPFEPAVAIRGVTIERTTMPPRIAGRLFLRPLSVTYLLVESHGYGTIVRSAKDMPIKIRKEFMTLNRLRTEADGTQGVLKSPGKKTASH